MNNWPYTNMHELNLDWIITKIKHIEETYGDIDAAADAAIARIQAQENLSVEELNTLKDTILSALSAAQNLAIAAIDADKTSALSDIEDKAEEAVNLSITAINQAGTYWNQHVNSLLADMPADLASLTQTMAIIGNILTGDAEQDITWFVGDYAGGSKNTAQTSSDASTNIIIGGAGLRFTIKLEAAAGADTKLYAIRWFTAKGDTEGSYTGESVVSLGLVSQYTWTVPDSCYAFSVTVRNSQTPFSADPSDIATMKWRTDYSDLTDQVKEIEKSIAPVIFNGNQNTTGSTVTAGSWIWAQLSPVDPYKLYRVTEDVVNNDHVSDSTTVLIDVENEIAALKSAINGNVNPVMTTFAVPIYGKNRFDKNSNNIINGYYIDSSGKPIQPNAAYFTSDYIYVADCTQIHISGGSLNGTYIAFYDAMKVLKGTVQGESGSYNTYSVPSGCAFIRFSSKLTAIDNLQVEKGNEWTQYSSYTKPVISNKKDFLKVASNVLVVAKDGTGDFTTITSAFNYANTIQSANNPVTIFIMPGVYKESLNSGYHKYISFIGANKHDVIWRYDTGLYDDDPLKYANCGIIKGITFISTHDDTSDFESTYTGTELTNYASYGLHLDTGDYSTSLNTRPFETIIEDCIIISKQAPAIGCGMCPYQTLHIKNCELIMDIPAALLDAHDSAGKGCLLIHRAFMTSVPATTVYVSSNIIRATTGITWQLGKPTDIQAGVVYHLYNNVSWSSINGKGNNSIHGYSLGVADIAADCFGNNVSALNA